MRKKAVFGLVLLTAACATVQKGWDDVFAQVSASAHPRFDAKRYSKIAIVVRAIGREGNPELAESAERSASTSLAGELMKKGYDVADRADVEAAIRESEFRDMTSGKASELGKLLQSQGVMLVEITGLRSTYGRDPQGRAQHKTDATMSMRLIDVDSSAARWTATAKLSSSDSSAGIDVNVVSRMAVQVGEEFPDHPSVKKDQ